MARLRRIALVLLALVVFALVQLGFSQTATAGRPSQLPPRQAEVTDIAAVQKVLDMQVAAWNSGDLEGYMSGYWKSQQLTFFAGGTVTRGWDATLARYRKRYQSAGKASMGKLDFADIEIQVLGPRSALARGRWHLAMADGKQLGGLTTVIFRRLPEGWRIVHDHSCSD